MSASVKPTTLRPGRHSQTAPQDRDDVILLVANYESDVGYAWWLMDNFWHVIATALAPHGRQCLLAYPKLRTIPELIRNSTIKPVEFCFSRGPWMQVMRGLQFIRAHRVRSIYLSDWPPSHWVYLLWRLAGVKSIVLHVHSGGEARPAGGLRAWPKEVLQASRIFSATLYVAPSNYMCDRLQAAARIPARRCAVVTNGIHLFQRDEARKPAVRRRLGIPEDAVLIVLVSRVTYAKGVDFAVRCIAKLLRDDSLARKVYAVHCGEGPNLPAFEQMAKDAGIINNFRFLGRRDDVREILCAADIGFHCSQSEAMSLAILEFMCAELAIVCSDLRSVCTAVENNVTALTYKHENLDDAVVALHRVIVDPTLRRSLGVAGGAVCRERYDLTRMNEDFISVVIPALS